MTNKLLTKIGDQVSIYLYDNGYMIEVSGKDVHGDWRTLKTVCKDSSELLELVKEYIAMDRDN